MELKKGENLLNKLNKKNTLRGAFFFRYGKALALWFFFYY
jgi:hypothetical protein